MSKSLSFDAFLAALAVLASGCARAETKASPAPETTIAPGVAASATPAEAPPATAAAPVIGATETADAGGARGARPAAAPPAQPRKASASCGAGQCSDDMKKK